MKEDNSIDVCPDCSGELRFEKRMRSIYGGHTDLHRCMNCKRIVEEKIDLRLVKKFPMVQDIAVKVHELHASTTRGLNEAEIYTSLYLCTKPGYHDPGIHIEQVVRGMIEERLLHKEINEFCPGVKSSPKGRKKTPCDQYFTITIDLILDEN